MIAANTETGKGVMGDIQRGERLQIMLNEEELKAIDEWRFVTRMPSRASAIRELLKRGLTAEGFGVASARTKSADFGVIDDVQNNSGK
jgi:hypothetical protein